MTPARLSSFEELPLGRFGAIIFDMDGVLVDSEPVHLRSSIAYLNGTLGIAYDRNTDREFLGSTDRHMFETLKTRYDLTPPVEEMIAARKSIYLKLLDNGIPLRPDIAPFLTLLQESPTDVALASSALRVIIHRILSITSLESRFGVVVSGEDVRSPKPHPDIFLEAARQLGVSPGHCCVIEDTYNGVTAAKAAGMAAVAFPCNDTLGHDFSHADYLIIGSDIDSA